MKKSTILAVDDTLINLELISAVFDDDNFKVLTATNGTDALRIIEDTPPDLILLDVIMPNIDGFKLCEIIKSKKETKDIPIIFITALTNPKNIVKAFKAGAVDYVAKPFNESELKARVVTHLDLLNSKRKLKTELQLRKIIEKELRKSEEHLLLAQKAGKTGTWEWNIKKDKIFWSEMTYEIFGIEQIRKYITLDKYLSFIHPDDKDRIIDELYLAKRNKQLKHKTEYRIIKETGEIRWIEEISEITINKEDSVSKKIGIIRDITEQKKQTADLEKLSTAVHQSADTIVFTNIDGDIEYANPKFTELTGYSIEEVLGENPRVLKSGEQSDEFYKEMWKTISSGKAWRGEFHNKTKDGRLFWEKATITPIKNEKNEITNYLAVKEDITLNKKLEEELIQTKNFAENLIDTANALIVSLNTQGEIIIFNKHAENLTGYSKSEVIGKNWFDIFIQEKDKPVISEIFINVLEKMPKVSSYENEILTKDGEEIDISWSNNVTYNSENNITGVLSIGRDITEQNLMQEALIDQNKKLFIAKKQAEENELNFKTIFNKSRDLIFITSFSGEIINVNNGAYSLLGYKKEELIGLNISILKSPQFMINRNNILKTLKKEQTIIFETENISKTGEIISLEVNSTIIKYYGREVILSAGRDIRERKNSQKKLLSAIIETEEKERERIAQDLHDGLGPLMSTIKLYVQWLAKPDSKADKTELAGKAEKTVEEAYKSLRNISNNLSPHILKNFGLISAVKSFIDRIKDISDIKIEFTTNIIGRFDSIKETIIYRILTEAINNTLKHADATQIKIKINNENSKITTFYTDNGIGFDVSRVIDQKKGLGLFNIKNRLKSIGGNIEIISGENKGTKIVIEV